MTDWKTRARGLAPDIPEKQLEAIGPVLEALEDAFRPIAATLPHATESALEFRAGDLES